METSNRRQILASLLAVFRPIVRILLRYGIGVRDLSEIIKTAYVEVATADYGRAGKPTSISKVASLTNMTRKEVSRIRDVLEMQTVEFEGKTLILEGLMHHWHANDEFLNDTGRPKTLPFEGELESFRNLVEHTAPGVSAEDVRREMIRVDAIEENPDGTLSVKKRTFRLGSIDQVLANSLLHHVYPLLSTIAHNTDVNRHGATRPQRAAYSRSISNSQLPALRRITKDRIANFVVSVDDTFIAYEASKDNEVAGNPSSTVAIGVYFYEEDNESLGDNW